MRKIILAVLGIAVLLLGIGGVALAQAPVPVPAIPSLPVVAATQSTSATPTSAEDEDSADPALLQLCAATGIEQADALLKQIVAAKPSALDPIADIVVPPGTQSPTIVAAAQLADVKKRLNCKADDTAEPTTSNPAPTTTASPAPTTGSNSFSTCAEARAAGKAPLLVGDPGYSAALDPDNDGIACEDADNPGTGSDSGGSSSLPVGGVDTGDGSTV